MEFIEKLLDGVEVEWKPLSDVAEYVRGLTYNKANESSDGSGYKVLRANNITLSGSTINFDDVKIVKHETKVKPSQKLYKNDILVSAASGSREHVGKVAFINSDIDFYFGGFMGVVRCLPGINPRFLFHVLTSGIFQKYLDEMLNSSTINNLSSSVMNAFQIPIPCQENPKKSLDIQAEIVRILDAFTAMTAELTAELNLRQQQYNYYRDQLLSFEEGEVEWKTLGDVCVIGDGNHSSKYPRSDEMVEEGVPFIRGTNMVNGTISSIGMKFITPEKHQELKKGHLKAYDVLIANRGEIGKIAQVPKHFSGSNLNSQLAWLRAKQEILLPRFLFYVLNTSLVQSTISGEGGALQQLTIKNIKLIRIPVPSIEEQSGIVEILDKFDTLTTSLTEGLPREIALRQQQYEYYRDLLFNFPEPKEAVA